MVATVAHTNANSMASSTAYDYKDETQVGQGIADSLTSRDSLFGQIISPP